MNEPGKNMREELMELVHRRDELEARIVRALEELASMNVSMEEPLVDSEGYPRNDIDICAVRTLRNLIVCSRNDCKALTEKIEQGLHQLHASAAEGNPAAPLPALPFAEVEIVNATSPAEKAGLRPGDLITKFAHITVANFQNLANVASVVNSSVGKSIRVNVLRNDATVALILVPEEWSGPGYVGCKIVPIKS